MVLSSFSAMLDWWEGGPGRKSGLTGPLRHLNKRIEVRGCATDRAGYTRMRLCLRFTISLFLLAGCLPARAEVGVLLDAKPNVGREIGNEITGAGHSGVYLSRVCTATPVQLRLCKPGEMGSVLQNYTNYGENEPYEWNAVPLSVYLYGVDDPSQRPLFGSPEIRRALQDRYRDRYLQQVCTSKRCIKDPDAGWRDSVAAAFVREIYIFEVNTTPEQDEQFIREFNARANVDHYSGYLRNCADFSKLVVNIYFPHSAHRNLLNDLGATSPKAVARSFTHYAERHPELDLRVIRIEQVPGTYKRSSDSHEATEQMFRAKKWLVPTLIVGYQAVPVLVASYFLTGRFSPDHELEKHPSEEAALLSEQLAEARGEGENPRRQQLGLELRREREQQIGDEQQWAKLQQRFEEVLQTAIADGIVSDRRELRNLFRDLQARGQVYVDDREQAWMKVESGGELRLVGLSTSNVLAAESDRRLGLQLLLARTETLLWAQPKHRELYPEIQADWALLQRAEDVMSTRGDRVIATRQ